MTKLKATRRNAIQGLLAISAAGALASCGSKTAQAEGETELGDAEFASFKGFFTDSEMAMLTALADTIIPTTDTPGAVEAGVPAELQSLATLWGDDNYRAYWRKGVRALTKTLPDFTGKDPAAREAQLGAYDAKVFGGQTNDGFYRDMKSTIATAYYMSEPGATLELAYEPVPGEWKGCVPLADYPKTWAT
jgi:hypothetical protein